MRYNSCDLLLNYIRGDLCCTRYNSRDLLLNYIRGDLCCTLYNSRDLLLNYIRGDLCCTCYNSRDHLLNYIRGDLWCTRYNSRDHLVKISCSSSFTFHNSTITSARISLYLIYWKEYNFICLIKNIGKENNKIGHVPVSFWQN